MPSVHGKGSLAKIQSGIDNLAPFDVASVHGVKGTAETGWMRGDTLAQYREASAKIDFTVSHYYTPVAWHTPDGWVINPDKYSPSTTATVGRLSTMIHYPGFYS